MVQNSGGLEGHVSRECTMETKAKSCYKCGQEGHIVNTPQSSPILCVNSSWFLSLCSPVIAPKTLLPLGQEASLQVQVDRALNVTAAEK